jgi:four helix bundle protein
VWQSAIELSVRCYQLTKRFPREEAFGLTSQIRRAAVSIAANIAEGHGRDGTAHFVQFLRVAQGSLKELETHLIISERVELLTGEQSQTLLAHCDEVGRMLRSLIRALQDKT